MPPHTVRPAIARLLLIILPATVALALLSCGGKDTTTAPPQPVALVQVTPGTDTLGTLGRTRQLTAAALDASHQPVAGVAIAWSSSAPGVASVDASTGLVTAVANGVATISAVAGSVTGQANLTVAQVVATVQVSPGTATLTTVGTQPFTAVARDSNSNAITGVRFVWQSSDPTVATIDTNGLAQAKASGLTYVTASGRGVPGNATFFVIQTIRHLGFVAKPDTVRAGIVFARAVQVEIRDSAGARIPGAQLPVVLTIGTGPTGATLVGTTTVNAVAGVATFSGLSLGGTTGSYRIAASTASVVSDTSSAVVVRAGAPARLAVASPGTVTAGVGFAVSAQAYDAYDNAAVVAPDTVTLTATNGLGGHLDAPLTAQLAAGTASFANVVVTDPGRFVLSATSHAATGAGSTDASLTFDTTMALGTSSTCALSVEHHAFCWGFGQFGQLGNGRAFDSYVPRLVTGGLTFTQIAVGYYHTCGVTGTGAAYCWGLNNEGQLGNGVLFGSQDTVPRAVTGGLSFTEVAVGSLHSCGVTTTNKIYCWGDDSRGQLGDAKTGSLPYGFTGTPVQVLGGLSWAHVVASASFFSTCGLTTTGAAYCWGENDYAALGTNSTADDSVPTAVVGGVTFRALASGSTHVCALAAADSTAYCWGTNGLGRGTPDVDSVAAPVSGGTHFTRITAGGDQTCAVAAAGGVYCWHSSPNPSQRLPDLDGRWTNVPGAFVVGGGHQCEIIVGAAFCLGDNGNGQLGIGTLVAFLADFTRVYQAPPPPLFAPPRQAVRRR